MSAPAPSRQSVPVEGQAPLLTQDEPARPGDFGIDVRRLRRMRRIAFAILALPILVLSLLIVRFVSMPLTQGWSSSAYQDEEYSTAIERLAPVETLNWFEPYLPHLTRGTDLLQEGQDASAEKELRTALTTWEAGSDLNQPAHAECKIRNNLAIAIERQAEKIADPGARGDRLYEAEEILAPCAGGGGGNGNEDQSTTGDNGERLEDERKKADEEAGRAERSEPGKPAPTDPREDPSNHPVHEDPSGTKPPEEAPTPGEATEDSKQDELEQRNKGANDGSGEDSTGGSDQKPAKPW